MNIKSIFGITKQETKTATLPPEETYTIGYEVHSKDGAFSVRFYNGVLKSEREDIRKSVHKELECIEAVNLATLEKKEFVNINGNIMRLSDFSKVSSFDKIEKKDEYTR